MPGLVQAIVATALALAALGEEWAYYSAHERARRNGR